MVTHIYSSDACEEPWKRLGVTGKQQLEAACDGLPRPADDARIRNDMRHECTVAAASGPRRIIIQYDYKRQFRLRQKFTVRCFFEGVAA
jgi:hypothetical protein